MSRAEKVRAQDWLEKLRKEGVVTSVTQVGKYYEEVENWSNGSITRATLCDRTGWTVEAPAERIHRAELPTGILRHVRAVLERDSSEASKEALLLLPQTDV